jgi:hypothetical protein
MSLWSSSPSISFSLFPARNRKEETESQVRGVFEKLEQEEQQL